MSLQAEDRESDVLQSSASSSLISSRKRSRSNLDSFSFDDSDGYSSSINPLFLVSGPRGGAISVHGAAAELAALIDLVDDCVYDVVKRAWDAVAVPADMYWSCPQHPTASDTTATMLRSSSAAASGRALLSSPPPLRIPDPRHLLSSFYPTRMEALAARRYQPHRGFVPVGLDRRGGKGSKVFNVLTRWEVGTTGASPGSAEDGEKKQHGGGRVQRSSAVARFVDTIPRPTDRNLYVLVDEECPIDPYFDVDFSYDADVDQNISKLSLLQALSGAQKEADFIISTDATAVNTSVLGAEVVERALLTILRTLREEVEKAWCTPVEQCLVLTSSLQLGHQAATTTSNGGILEQLKLSFHVHFRLANRAAEESVRELHAFMAALRLQLLRAQHEGTSSDDPQKVEAARRATLLLECVDFGVYTRWRAFRLPYNVKAPESHDTSKPLADGAGDDLLSEQLALLGISVPNISVGLSAPRILQSVVYAADVDTQRKQRYLVEKLMLYFRYLLPLLPGATQFATTELESFLKSLTPSEVVQSLTVATSTSALSPKEVISAWVMEMACIVRDASELPFATPDSAAAKEKEKSATTFKLLQYRSAGAEHAATTVPAPDNASPFDMPMPPMPRSARVRVDDKGVMKLLAEVFWCLGPEYGPAARSAGTSLDAARAETVAHKSCATITPERINAQFEESIRAYYVYQKQSKFCFRLQRAHKATYAQLYLTFGSIKVRCYSNDCCDHCCFIPWEAPTNPKSVPEFHAGYPRFDRLAEIHSVLFPPLPVGELVRRYGTAVLHHQFQQQM